MFDKDWIRFLTRFGCFWAYDGNPESPHVLVSDNLHSNVYYEPTRFINDPRILVDICKSLIDAFVDEGEKYEKYSTHELDIVFGVGPGSSFIAFEIAKRFSRRAGFTIPIQEDKCSEMIIPECFKVNPENRVMLVTDDFLDGDKELKAIEALERQRAIVVPVVLALVNRSGLSHYEGRRIVSVIDVQMHFWHAGHCPLCKAGSKALCATENLKQHIDSSINWQ